MNGLEKSIIKLRKEGYTYKEISDKLSGVTKQLIRETLLEHAPKIAKGVY